MRELVVRTAERRHDDAARQFMADACVDRHALRRLRPYGRKDRRAAKIRKDRVRYEIAQARTGAFARAADDPRRAW